LRFTIVVCLLAILSIGLPGAGGSSETGFKLLVIKGQQLRWTKRAGKTLVLKYAFVSRTQRFDAARNCRSMHPVRQMAARSHVSMARFRREVAAGLAQWSRVADVQFREVADTANADIVIGARLRQSGSAFADVLARDDGVGGQTIGKSLICFNPVHAWKIGFDGDLTRYDIRYAVTHESGHVLGLDHPSRSGQLMSFRYDERFRSLREGDARGAILLYGHARQRTTRLISHRTE
jgi:Matrixin